MTIVKEAHEDSCTTTSIGAKVIISQNLLLENQENFDGTINVHVTSSFCVQFYISNMYTMYYE